jgi:hypothetical protein
MSPFFSTKGMHCMIHNIATGLPHQWVVAALGKCGKNTTSPWRNLNHLSKKKECNSHDIKDTPPCKESMRLKHKKENV